MNIPDPYKKTNYNEWPLLFNRNKGYKIKFYKIWEQLNFNKTEKNIGLIRFLFYIQNKESWTNVFFLMEVNITPEEG